MELTIENLRTLCNDGKIIWKDHAAMRMRQREIKTFDVENCIATGEIIELYAADYPAPSSLVLGFSIKDMHLHVVCSIYQDMLCVITAYFPNLDEWENDYRTRKVVQ